MANYKIKCEAVEVRTKTGVCPGSARCRQGETYVIGARTPQPAMCGRAFHAMHPAAFAMRFSEQAPFEKGKGHFDVICPDGAVVYRLSRIVEQANCVERAIRKRLHPGQQLATPDRQKPFILERMDERGIVLLFGRKQTPVRLLWSWLEGVPDFIRGHGWVRIAGVYTVGGDPETLDGYFKRFVNTATANWAAVVLQEAGVLEIALKPLRVRLAPGW